MHLLLTNIDSVVRAPLSGQNIKVFACGQQDPSESINYIACHDNRTLWDLIALKAPPSADLDTRLRMNLVSMHPLVGPCFFFFPGTGVCTDLLPMVGSCRAPGL